MINKKINKILIIRLSALGDTIHTLPLANSLRNQYPNIQIDWVVEDKAEKFIINNPLINNVYVLERKKWKNLPFFKKIKEFFILINKIRHEKYDVVIDTQQLFKSSFIMGLSNSKRKIALDGGREFSWIFANEIIKTGKKQFDIDFHVVKRNLEIAKYLGCEELEPEFVIPNFESEYSDNIKNIMNSLDKNKKTIVLSPATTWANKHWTIQGWIDIISEFKNKYNIIITASEKEKVLTEKILEKFLNENLRTAALKYEYFDSSSPTAIKYDTELNIIDLSGKTSISDLIFVYKNADMVISPDSGSAHCAWACQKPAIVTLFFSTSAMRTAPYGNNYFSIQSDISCSPCMKKRCINKNSLNCCMHGINSKEVINIVKKVLQ